MRWLVRRASAAAARPRTAAEAACVSSPPFVSPRTRQTHSPSPARRRQQPQLLEQVKQIQMQPGAWRTGHPATTPAGCDRAADRDRDGAAVPASGWLRLQAPDLVAQAQGDRPGGVGKKRLRVEAFLAAAASPELPPIDDLMPDPLLRDELPEDLPWLPRLLPRADLYLQDEVQLALHPTLTRVWCPQGRRGQRLVEAPDNNAKEYGFGLVDWRAGGFDGQRAPGRRAVRRAVTHTHTRESLPPLLEDADAWAHTIPPNRHPPPDRQPLR